uniref:Putative capsid protein n=1 Tax=viral metagenome TaxID=1070528 RepID=A0A6M3KU46_9ZZZZ
MAIQTATTGQLENAQNIIIAESRFTMEHNAPCRALIEHMSLPKGAKQVTVPKVGQMTAQDLTDGVDLTDTDDIGMTTQDFTTGEVGLKVILTDKLLRQENEDVFKIIGRQMGDAHARKVDTDIIALFASLNGGTTLGADNVAMNMAAVSGVVAFAKANKFPSPISIVHHPNAVAELAKAAAAIGATYYAGIMPGLSDELLRNFWKINISQVNIFEDGNIAKITGYDSGYGAVFSKSAMVMLESKGVDTERERDASLRAWEVVMIQDYGVWELDDTYGAPVQYEIGQLVTT